MLDDDLFSMFNNYTSTTDTEEDSSASTYNPSSYEEQPTSTSYNPYLSDNNYLTLTTKELSDFIDGYIRVPRNSTVITIDDGTLVERGIKILESEKKRKICGNAFSQIKRRKKSI